MSSEPQPSQPVSVDVAPILGAAVILVDRRGRLLLQLRDHDAPNYPDVWGLPGGHVEPSEDVAAAAARELFEETSLTPDDALVPYDVQHVTGWVGPGGTTGTLRIKHYFYGTTCASQDDVVVGEGVAMVFAAPEEALDGRPYTPGTADVLRSFIASPIYAGLVAYVRRRGRAYPEAGARRDARHESE